MPLPPDSTIGILGGGQLGRMSAIAAAELGYRTHLFSPEADCPAAQVCSAHTMAHYGDEAALRQFAHAVDVITLEFENIPPASVQYLAQFVPTRPGHAVLQTTRHRLREKTLARALGLQTAPFARVTSLSELEEAAHAIGLPAILKTTEEGYDGKGQVKLTHPAQLTSAWQQLNTREAILEGFIHFQRELSILIARNPSGQVRCYPLVENSHQHHILHRTLAPAPHSDTLQPMAEHYAHQLAEALQLEGILAIEWFATADGELLFNEMAPRPHNSGHWTQDGCITSQFEQHIRAVCDLPLGETAPLCPTEMINLIGDDVLSAQQWLQTPHAKLHLYGKGAPSAGRKMGHVNLLKPTKSLP